MKKKIFVIFLTVCFLSAPLSAKAMMFDAIPKINDDYSVQISKLVEILKIVTADQRGAILLTKEETYNLLNRTYAFAQKDVDVEVMNYSSCLDSESFMQGGSDILWMIYIFTFFFIYVPLLVILVNIVEPDLGIPYYTIFAGIVPWTLIFVPFLAHGASGGCYD